MAAIWQAGPADQSERFVLLALADNANDDGECWPSVATIARKTCMAERSVRRVFKRLCESGWLAIEAGGGRKNCNLYRIKTLTLGQPDQRSAPCKNPDPGSLNPDPGSLNPDPGSAEPSRTIIEPSLESSAQSKGNDDAERKSGSDETLDHATGTAKRKTGTAKRAIGERAEPTEKDIQHAEQHGIDWRAEWPKFRDYHIRAETRTTDRGWRATWRSWCRKAVEFAERARSNGAPRRNGRRMDWNQAAALVMAEQANAEAVVDDGGWPDWFTGDAPMPGAAAPGLPPGSDGSA